jgi:hypothetical protein
VTHQILNGPIPDASGCVVFTVGSDDNTIEVAASPQGIGVPPEAPPDLVNEALAIVATYLKEHADEELEWYRRAATLRRSAGQTAPVGNTRDDTAEVSGRVQSHAAGAVLKVLVASIEIRVLVSARGGLMDETDDWDLVTDVQRDAAITKALDYLLENPQEARSVGLDPDLLGLLWR